jgi:serine/threonine protein kinase
LEAETLRKMNGRNRENVVRFITAFTRGDANVGRSYYLMFEWADGGSLADVWSEHKNPGITTHLMKQTVEQLLGLAKAIEATHYDEIGGTRHGDLKPENILRFQPCAEKILGTLKIGDWGLAKYHNENTMDRQEMTSARFFTVLYEAPEWGLKQPLGRQYDIWSMGVIILELLIWLLYGFEEIQRFKKDVMGPTNDPEACYMVRTDPNRRTYAVLRKVVENWIEHIAKDPSCAKGTAMGELLDLIKTKLLVVDLPETKSYTGIRVGPVIVEPPRSEQTTDPSQRTLRRFERATSGQFVIDLERIHTEDEVIDYWCKAPPDGYKRIALPKPAPKAPQDDAGRLLPGGETINRPRQLSPDNSLAHHMSTLGVQEQHTVSLHSVRGRTF